MGKCIKDFFSVTEGRCSAAVIFLVKKIACFLPLRNVDGDFYSVFNNRNHRAVCFSNPAGCFRKTFLFAHAGIAPLINSERSARFFKGGNNFFFKNLAGKRKKLHDKINRSALVAVSFANQAGNKISLAENQAVRIIFRIMSTADIHCVKNALFPERIRVLKNFVRVFRRNNTYCNL